MPAGISLNTSDMIVSSTTSGVGNGTVVGNTTMKQLGSSSGIGKVYVSNQNSTYGLILDCEATLVISTGIHGSENYPYGYSSLYYAFEAMVSIN